MFARKSVNRYPRRVQQRLPCPTAGVVVNQEAVGIVHFRPPRVQRSRRVLSIEIHAGQSGNAQLLDGLSCEQHGPDVETSDAARRNHKLVRPRQARTVQQRIHRHACGPWTRTYEPEFYEVGKLFARWEPGVDCRAAYGQSPLSSFANGAEVAGASEHQEFGVTGAPVERIQQFEARISEIVRNPLLQLFLVEREMVLLIWHALDSSSDNLIDGDRVLVHATGHQRSYLKHRVGISPKVVP